MNDPNPLDNAIHRTITKIPYDQRAVPEVAALLGVDATLAPFQLPGGDVHQLTLNVEDGRPGLMLTLWPTIRRVDAIGPGIAVVFTNVSNVDLIPGVEVLFRRSSREFLIVTCAGKVIVRS